MMVSVSRWWNWDDEVVLERWEGGTLVTSHQGLFINDANIKKGVRSQCQKFNISNLYAHYIPLLSVFDFENFAVKGVLPLPGANNQEVGDKTLANYW